MNIFQNFDLWTTKHYPNWLAFVRMALGAFLCIKGFIFIADTDALYEIMKNSEINFAVLVLAHYVAFAHLFGGIFIAVGLITRISSILQIPILLGAVIFVNADKGFFSGESELLISLIVLILLIVFAFLGSGRLSFAHYIIQQREKNRKVNQQM